MYAQSVFDGGMSIIQHYQPMSFLQDKGNIKNFRQSW